MQTEEHRLFFQTILEQHKGIVLKVVHTYSQHEEDRKDLIQEIMIQIWQSLHRYNSDYKISTWLYRVSLNVAISSYRKNATRNNNVPLNEQTYQIKEKEKSENQQQLDLLRQFINNLKEIDKALMLLYLEENSYREIAEILGITETNVATKISRIKTNLKQQFLNIKDN